VKFTQTMQSSLPMDFYAAIPPGLPIYCLLSGQDGLLTNCPDKSVI